MGAFHSKPSISQGQGLITIHWAFLTSSPSALWFPEVGITLWGQDPTLLSQDPTPTNLLNAMVRQHLGSTMARELLCPAPEPPHIHTTSPAPSSSPWAPPAILVGLSLAPTGPTGVGAVEGTLRALDTLLQFCLFSPKESSKRRCDLATAVCGETGRWGGRPMGGDAAETPSAQGFSSSLPVGAHCHC